eukprot:Colp12_sorted_trinity150504_noHs@5915
MMLMIEVKVKHNKDVHTLSVDPEQEWVGVQSTFSKQLYIPPDKMKLIYKGKLITADNYKSVFAPGITILAIGKTDERNVGLHERDFEVIWAHLMQDREATLTALEAVDSNLVEALLDAERLD